MGFILWLVVGGVIGWLASMIMRTDAQQSIFLNIVVVIIDAFIGGLLISGGSINELAADPALVARLGAPVTCRLVRLGLRLGDHLRNLIEFIGTRRIAIDRALYQLHGRTAKCAAHKVFQQRILDDRLGMHGAVQMAARAFVPPHPPLVSHDRHHLENGGRRCPSCG